MKNIIKQIIITVFVASLSTSCDDKKIDYNDLMEQSSIPIGLSIIVGQKEHCEYFEYNPALSYAPKDTFYGSYESYHNINLDGDNIMEFALKRIENIDTIGHYYKYSQNIKIAARDYFAFYDMEYLDTIDYTNNSLEKYNAPYYEWEINSFSETRSSDGSSSFEPDTIWNEWDKDLYFYFVRAYPDIIIGWVRMELVSEGNLIKIKDCGIKRKGVEYN